MTARFGKAQKAAALVPLAALSAAWTISLTGLGAGSAEATGTQPPTLPDGTVIPSTAIQAPATVSAPDTTGTGPDLSGGKAQQIVASADSSGIPAAALAAYQRAASVIDKADKSCHLDWQLLAAIGRIESNHGRSEGNTLNDQGIATPGIFGPELNGADGVTSVADTDGGQYDGDTTYDRAVGPMQFIPSTWSVVGVDADGDGQRNPQDINDASLAAAVYLCSGDDDLSTLAGQKAAVYRYNHSEQYVATVLGVAQAYEAGDFTSVPNFTVPAAFLTPAPGGTPATKKHHHNKKKTSTNVEKTPVTPAPPMPTSLPADPDPSATPAAKPSNKPTPKVPSVPGASTVTQPLQDTVASVAQLTQVCTQALVADGVSNPATAAPQALQKCVTQLTGETLPQAEKDVTNVIAGLASLLQGLLGGLLGKG
jgi:membrane-bound lytic murein transglycosylase B